MRRKKSGMRCWAPALMVLLCLVVSPGVSNLGAMSSQGGSQASSKAPVVRVAGKTVYYSDTIKDIILADCARCHSGASRNLMDYDSLKAYADSGVLEVMVQGPMAGFAGSDAETILEWVRGGALEKPAPAPAAFGAPSGRVEGGGGPGAAGGKKKITYENTIQFILAERCLRCHSGPFRNLTTYENVRIYVDNGLLKTLVQPGGPMHRFAGPDSRKIVQWVDSGAPLGGASL